MEIPIKDLTIGVVSAVIGAAVVGVGASGWKFATESRKAAKQAREAEITDWKSGDATKQANVTLRYIFAILAHFLIANLFWLVPDLLDAFATASQTQGIFVSGETWAGWSWVLALIFRFISLIFFFLGLGRIVRFVFLEKARGG